VTGDRQGELLLGRATPLVDAYAPQLLYPIARADGRRALQFDGPPPFSGVDVWHAYELSWLDDTGAPRAAVGRISVPADTPNMVESKSLKLYLNSLHNTRYASSSALIDTIERDLSAVAGGDVDLTLWEIGDPSLAGAELAGTCLDGLAVAAPEGGPDAGLLNTRSEASVEEALYTHLLRSLCPVTGQPDWATLWLRYRGRALDRDTLLAYLLGYRNHREFHEQCVERIFIDILRCCAPGTLEVQGFYTRRGGLDINPYRCSDPSGRPLPRLNRQ